MATSGASKGTSPEAVRESEARAYTLQAIAPQRFGKYTLIGKLGQGGMAEVLLGVASGKAGFRKLFVLKRLHAQLEGDPGFVDMFLDEARLAAQLDHPHCVHTVEVGEIDGVHFLAMEHLEGQGLERLLRSSAAHNEPLPVEIVARIIADALDGLGYAHDLEGFDGKPLGIVHRDVSPQNLFVTYNGVVKVLDFGIAKAETNVVETRTGVIKGKYAYMAPEQATGGDIDARADLWSMGIVLWESLTSRRLFKSTNELATLHETLHAEVRPPSVHRADVPPALDAIAMQALQRDPFERYQSAAEFKDALEAWLSTLPHPPSRRHIAALMKERFEDVQRLHKEKLVACLAALEVGPGTIQRLVEHEGTGPGLRSGELDLESSRPDLRSASVTPTPAPSVSHVAPAGSTAALPAEPTRAGTPSSLRSAPSSAPDADPAKNWKRAAIGLAAVALAAVVVALTSLRGESPTDAPLAQAPAPQAAVPLEAVPVEAEPLEAVPVEAVPTEAAPIEAAARPPGDDALGVPAEDPPTRPSATPRATDTPARPEDAPRPLAPRERAAPRERTASEDGYLSLVTSPWTNVSLGGRALGETPLVRVRLPAGHHTLRLTNPEAGIAENYDVDIEPGETTTRRLGLR